MKYKLKNKSGAKKRFWFTASGKASKKSCNHRHKMTCKSTSTKVHHRLSVILKEKKLIKDLLPSI